MKKMKIRTRLTLLYTTVLMLLLVVMFAAFYGIFSKGLYDNAANKIVEYAGFAADEIELDDGEVEVDMEDDDLYDIVHDGLLSVYSLDGALIFSNHQTSWLEALPREDGRVRRVDEGYHWQVYDMIVRDEGQDVAWLRLAMPLDDVIETTSNFRFVFMSVVPLCLVVSLLSGFWITRRVLHPIQQITQTARDITRGDISKRMDFEADGDEIAELGNTFDDMLDSLEAAFAREKQFSSDASHELRTPIAVILAQAEAALAEEGGGEENYRKALETIAEKAKDMQRILSQLLMLARGHEGLHNAEMIRADASAVVEDIAMEMRPMADEKRINVQMDIEANLYIKMDLMTFTQMLMNLIDNAIKYGRESGWVRISLCRQSERKIALQVEDNGRGISEEDLPHIFERFYRSDKARSGEGFGLGLSIVKWIVDIHGGSIAVQSKEGEGTIFALTFPDAGINIS